MDNLQGLEKLEALTLKEKPPKLTLESIRSLLQQSLKLARDDSKIFLKYLLASKNFLNVARRYPIYTLIVYHRSPGTFLVSFGRNIDLADFISIYSLEKTHILPQNSYDSTFNLVKLLDPKHLYLDLGYGEKSNEILGQFETLFGLVRNGKTGLRLFEFNEESAALNRLAPYLNMLECDFNVLKNADVVSTLNLAYLMINSTLDEEKFNALLRYNVGKMTLNQIKIGDEGAITEMEKLQVNSSLQKLKIGCFIGTYTSLIETFGLLKHCSSRLRSLNITFDFWDDFLCPDPEDEFIKMDEVLKNLPKIHEKLKALQDHEVAKSLSSLVVCASSIFRVPKNTMFDRNWPEKLKHHEGFKNIDQNYHYSYAEFKSEYGFFNLTHQVEMYREYNSDSSGSYDYYDSDYYDYYDSDF